MSGELSELFLMVTDLEASVTFYEDTVGLDVIERGSAVRFDTRGATPVLESDFDEQTLAEFGLEPPGGDRGEGAIVVIEVDDPDPVYERAVDHGADAVMQPRDVDWGRRMALVRDPDGYVLEISTPIESQS